MSNKIIKIRKIKKSGSFKKIKILKFNIKCVLIILIKRKLDIVFDSNGAKVENSILFGKL